MQQVTFLRGINVRGHHKVPMSDLKILFESLGQTTPITLLNSGNVISTPTKLVTDEELGVALEERFGFPIFVVSRSSEQILALVEKDPFEGVEVSKSIRLYITFVWAEGRDSEAVDSETLDSESPSEIFTVVDLEDTSTVEALADIEKRFKKKVTTRNWNTIKRIAEKLEKKLD